MMILLLSESSGQNICVGGWFSTINWERGSLGMLQLWDMRNWNLLPSNALCGFPFDRHMSAAHPA